VDPEIADRVLARSQARKLAGLEPITLEGARERFGRRISEEELLLRLTMPAEQVDAMMAAGPARRWYNPEVAPLLGLLRELRDRPPVDSLRVDRADMRVELRRARGTP
jgi:oxaloacetate decarboxylase alpha subunit